MSEEDKMINKEDLKNKQLVELTYCVLKNKSVPINHPYIEKDKLVLLLENEPEYCYNLLIMVPEYFNSELKLQLIDYVSKDRDIFIKYIKNKNKTLAVQSKVAKLVADDLELALLFAETYINNWRVANIEEHVKKLKLTKEERQNLISNIMVVKLS